MLNLDRPGDAGPAEDVFAVGDDGVSGCVVTDGTVFLALDV